MHRYLIAYDVSDDRLRTKLADMLQDFGHRQQYSVFAAWLNESQYRKLLQRLYALCDGQPDIEVRIYRLCAMCQQHGVVIGQPDDNDAPPGPLIL